VQYAHKKGGICTMKKGNKKEGLNTIEVTDEMLAVIEQVQGRKAFEKEQAKQRNNGDRFVQLNTLRSWLDIFMELYPYFHSSYPRAL